MENKGITEKYGAKNSVFFNQAWNVIYLEPHYKNLGCKLKFHGIFEINFIFVSKCIIRFNNNFYLISMKKKIIKNLFILFLTNL